MKKAILILVDSLLPEILEKGFESRCIPALQYLKEKGSYRMGCVTVFPTMTASIDTSLITGAYPNEHKIPSLIWYDPHNKEMINYINGVNSVRKLGIKNCCKNVLVNLNQKHLSQHVKTLFEVLTDWGHTPASINLIIHRGYHQHPISFPYKKYFGIQENQRISGPSNPKTS